MKIRAPNSNVVLYELLHDRESNKICIVALTACALEMKASMRTLISNLLLNLSKISATKARRVTF